METFPTIETERLTLRKIYLSDLPDLIAAINNKKISDQVFNIPHPFTEEDAIYRMNFILQGFKNKERYVFVITKKSEDKLIGQIGIHLDAANNNAQIGYWLAEEYWGKGIATEANKAILKFGFEQLNLHKIYATHYPENPASGKVLINSGMIKEAELKEHYLINGEYRTVFQYRLTKDEYLVSS